MKKLRNGTKGKGLVAQRKMNATQAEEGKAMDELMIYEEFKASFIPLLREMIRSGHSVEKIRKAFAPVVQASMIQKALKGDFKAMKDTLDRYEGMAVQRVEQKTIHQSMGHDELAALVAQKARDVGLDKILEAKFKKVEEDADET
jgi:predicted glycosyl hydrolase (DUF1957 family)